MLFNSLIFLYAFLPLTLLVYWRLKTKNQRYIWLTIMSYVFYGFWNYKFCGFMLFSTIVAFAAGLGLLRTEHPLRRKILLVLPIAIDLALLAALKYVNMIVSTIEHVAQWLGNPLSVPHFDLILPVGISFYTFHTITYIVDAYRRTITPTKNFFEFSCYVSLFSQLVAGPIVRFRQIERDLENIDSLDWKRFWNRGWSFFTIGMIEKVIIADSIAASINPAIDRYLELSTLDAWLCAIGYTYQLYFDFAGYSNMAVGLGYMLGLHIPQNFNSPLKSLDIGDFWRRWHISLSTCLRDYLYITLGGSRGKPARTGFNIMVTMLLGGLWHGASWTFVVWGAYHGILLVLHRGVADAWNRIPALIRLCCTFLLVVIGFVIFRSPSIEIALHWLSRMFQWRSGVNLEGLTVLCAVMGVAAYFAHVAPNTFQISHRWSRFGGSVLTALFAICLWLIYSGQESPFLYFQF